MLKELRKKKKLTQEKLSELIGCDQSYISKIERYPSDQNLNLDIIFYIATSLDINYLDLITYFAKKRMEIFSKKC